jgi:tetratricopeptide (TPR) repeat protein
VLTVAVIGLAIFTVRVTTRPSEGPVQGGILEAGSLESRILYWVAAGRIFVDHPIVGTGPDTYYANYLPNRLAVAGARSGMQPADKPHNVIMEYAANSGVIGLVPYLAVAGLAIRYGLKRLRNARGHPRLLVAGFLAALSAYLAQAVFSIDVVPLAALNWIVLGGIAAAADPALLRRQMELPQAAPALPKAARPARRRVAFGVGMATLAGLVVVGTLPLRASVRAANADFTGALRMTPYFGEYPEREAILTMAAVKASQDPEKKLTLLHRARDLFEHADRLQPNDLEIHLQTAYMYTIWGTSVDPRRYVEAMDAWGRLLKLDPHDPELRGTYTQVKEQMRADLTQWDAAALAKPDDPAGWILVARGFLALEDATAARPALERALRVDPGNAEAQQLIARIPS